MACKSCGRRRTNVSATKKPKPSTTPTIKQTIQKATKKPPTRRGSRRALNISRNTSFGGIY